jgi:DNA-binding response OmpR family regulator
MSAYGDSHGQDSLTGVLPVPIHTGDVAVAQNDLILVADDDPHIVELVGMYLRRAGFRVETAFDGDEALKKANELHPALAILDVMMPGQDGLQICRTLSHRGDIPVVLLTARSTDIDKIAGLRIGADDYVTKPFNPEELMARVDAVLRRTRASTGVRPVDNITLGSLKIDIDARTAVVCGRTLGLTPKEFDLLVTFARFPNVVLDREQLLDLVWGTSFYAIRTVDVHVARLRDKLEGSGLKIETVWGSGYRLGGNED